VTFDPNQHGGRTQEQVESNEQAMEIIAEAIVCLLCLASVAYLVALVAGWL